MVGGNLIQLLHCLLTSTQTDDEWCHRYNIGERWYLRTFGFIFVSLEDLETSSIFVDLS